MYLFVYYKFNPNDYPHVTRDANKLIQAVAQAVPGLRARLLRRPHVGAAGECTWMETYEFDAGQQGLLESCLAERVACSGLPGGRRMEWFVEV